MAKKRLEIGIATLLAIGLMCIALPGCGGGGGESSSGSPSAVPYKLPIGITTDGTNLYIADSDNHTIRMVAIGGSGAGTLLGGSIQGTPLSLSTAVTTVTTTASIVAGTTGSFGFQNGTGSAARFDSPSGITTDGTNIYVADTLNHAIRQVAIATGVVTTLAGTGSAGSQDSAPGVSPEFTLPAGITTAGFYLYVADTGNNSIRRVNKTSGFTDTIAGVVGSSGFNDSSVGANARFNLPQGITTDGTNLFVADTNNHRVRKVSLGGTFAVSTLAGSGSIGFQDGPPLTAAEFNYPYGITSDGTNLFVADSNNNMIRKFRKDGTDNVVTVAGDALSAAGYLDNVVGTDARFNTPDGVTTNGKSLYVTDSANNKVREIQ